MWHAICETHDEVQHRRVLLRSSGKCLAGEMNVYDALQVKSPRHLDPTELSHETVGSVGTNDVVKRRFFHFLALSVEVKSTRIVSNM